MGEKRIEGGGGGERERAGERGKERGEREGGATDREREGGGEREGEREREREKEPMFTKTWCLISFWRGHVNVSVQAEH